MNCGVVDCNIVLVIIGLEGVDKDCVGFKMIGGHYVLITSAIPDGEVSIVACVNLGYRFDPNVHFF